MPRLRWGVRLSSGNLLVLSRFRKWLLAKATGGLYQPDRGEGAAELREEPTEPLGISEAEMFQVIRVAQKEVPPPVKLRPHLTISSFSAAVLETPKIESNCQECGRGPPCARARASRCSRAPWDESLRN